MSLNQKIMCYIWKSNNSRKKKEIAKSNQEKKNNNKSEKVYLEKKANSLVKPKKNFFLFLKHFPLKNRCWTTTKQIPEKTTVNVKRVAETNVKAEEKAEKRKNRKQEEKK